jgi:hypothetical protein
MPFQSEAQRRFLFANHPEIAKKWAHEFPGKKKLPKHKRKKTRKMTHKRGGKRLKRTVKR